MSRKKDLNSRATSSNFFALSFADIEKILESQAVDDDTGERLAIRMVDANRNFTFGHLVFEIIPQQELVIYRLPKSLGQKTYSVLALEALNLLLPHVKANKVETSEKTTRYIYYCAYLKDGVINLTQSEVRFKTGKFRDDSDFFSDFNLKNSVTRERPIK